MWLYFAETWCKQHFMKLDAAATVFAELGNRTRLEILRLLIKAGPDGLPIGDIQSRLDIPASTLAFHIRGVVGAGLVEQEKRGRMVLCRPCFEQINDAIAFLKENCCAGVGEAEPRRKNVA
jgi:DNA-binding transcriptional ArsR family regulator